MSAVDRALNSLDRAQLYDIASPRSPINLAESIEAGHGNDLRAVIVWRDADMTLAFATDTALIASMQRAAAASWEQPSP